MRRGTPLTNMSYRLPLCFRKDSREGANQRDEGRPNVTISGMGLGMVSRSIGPHGFDGNS